MPYHVVFYHITLHDDVKAIKSGENPQEVSVNGGGVAHTSIEWDYLGRKHNYLLHLHRLERQ